MSEAEAVQRGDSWCSAHGYACRPRRVGHRPDVVEVVINAQGHGAEGPLRLEFGSWDRRLVRVEVPVQPRAPRGPGERARLIWLRRSTSRRYGPGAGGHDVVIDLYYWTTPNGHKVTIALEELGLAYRVRPVNINKGEQFDPAFLRISPNNRIPAIVDDAPADHAGPLSIFESGAILTYLAEKTGRLLPADARGRFEVLQWLFWQVGGLGPMAGQNHHFVQYAPEKIPYAMDRYVKETARLYRVMNTRLADRPYLAGDYSIADIASYPWVVPHQKQQQNLDDFPNLKRWFATIAQRPAVERAYAVAREIQAHPMDDAAKKILFGHEADAQKR